MGNNHCTIRLPHQFKGRGKYIDYEYLTLRRKFGYGLFVVQNKTGVPHYEIAQIRTYLVSYSRRPLELYPDEIKLNKLFWQFDDYEIANNTFKLMVCETV